MIYFDSVKNNSDNFNESDTAVFNLTALWGLSEAFLGGLLHAFKIPFKGMIIGSIAVILMTLIASNSSKKGIILKACFVTIIIKLLVSPYTPPAAYFSVFIQGLLGELLYSKRNLLPVMSVILGIVTSVFSAFQRIIILTLLFGQEFWTTINQFPDLIYKEFFDKNEFAGSFNLSLWITGIYTGIHFIFGFATGIYAYRLSEKVKSESPVNTNFEKNMNNILSGNSSDLKIKPKKSKGKFHKFNRILVYGILLAALISSYVFSDKGYFDSKSIWIMIMRSVLIMVLWFKVFSPVVMKVFRNKILNSNNIYYTQADNIIKILPLFKAVINYSWKVSGEKFKSGKSLKRISEFAVIAVTIFLNHDFREIKTADEII